MNNMKKLIYSIALLAILIGAAVAEDQVNRAFIASWYNTPGVMANGEKYDPDRLTAASVDYPLRSILRVYRVHGSKAFVEVEVTDRINKRFKGKRIDLTPAAFKQLAPLEQGLVKVNVTVARRKSADR